MKFACAEQVRLLRYLVGLTKDEFAEATGIPRNRLDNIENKRSRMFAEDVICIADHFEPFIPWLLLNKDINMDELRASESPLLKLASSMFELNKYPPAFEGKFRSFSGE